MCQEMSIEVSISIPQMKSFSLNYAFQAPRSKIQFKAVAFTKSEENMLNVWRLFALFPWLFPSSLS